MVMAIVRYGWKAIVGVENKRLFRKPDGMGELVVQLYMGADRVVRRPVS
jgi:hypothetical protein